MCNCKGLINSGIPNTCCYKHNIKKHDSVFKGHVFGAENHVISSIQRRARNEGFLAAEQ